MIKNQQAVENVNVELIEETIEEFVLRTLGLNQTLAGPNPLSKRMEESLKVMVANLQELLFEELEADLELTYQDFFWRSPQMVDFLSAKQFENGLAITFKNRDRRFHVLLPSELVYQLSALVLNFPVSAILAEPTNKESTAICFLIAKILSESPACKGIYLCSSTILSEKQNSKDFCQFLSARCLENKLKAVSISILLEQVTHQVLMYVDANLLVELQDEESRKLRPRLINKFLQNLKAKYKITINIQAGLLANLFNLQNGQVWKLNLNQHSPAIDDDQLMTNVQIMATQLGSTNAKFFLPVELLPESVPGKLALKFPTNNHINKELP